jgi:sialate O-acetylesterase
MFSGGNMYIHTKCYLYLLTGYSNQKMKSNLFKLLSCCFLTFALTTAYAGRYIYTAKAFKPATLLQSNMVVQQNKPFRVWGFGPAGDKVEIWADWSRKKLTVTTDEQGNWQGQIKVPAAIPGNFTPHKLVIIHQKDTVTLTNILIGEVWICTGQSNMEMRVSKIPGWGTGILNYEQEAAAANYPNIRLFKENMGIEFTPMADCKGSWEICTPKTAGDFSAVGYFFGRELYNKLNIPIGLIDAAIPATACQAFVNIDVLNADTALTKAFVDPYLKGIADIQAKNDKKTTLVTLNYPGLVYNKMIFPLKKLSIAGFTWYQGESNKTDTILYTRLCTAMINSWRDDFAQGSLPFYYVQVAPFAWGKKDSTADYYAKFREAQGRVLSVKNTGMALTMDIGEPYNIHPLNKKPVGIRLADIALAKTYHITNTIYQGPQFDGFKVNKGVVEVSFTAASTGSGIKTTDGKAPNYFYVAGADKKFYKAAAVIVGNKVWLTAEKVSKPVAVRYAFTNYPVTNFENAEGFPAVPFRTDDWSN